MSDLDKNTTLQSGDAAHGSTLSYTIGFLLSLILTLAAYVVVNRHINHQALSHFWVMVIIFALAIGQLFIQLVCFLHLNKESKPRWNLTMLFFALMIVFVVIAGSMWIMYNLNYRMTPAQVRSYLQSQDGF